MAMNDEFAFPLAESEYQQGTGGGMLLRDYFAAAAIPPIIAHFASGSKERSWADVAEIAYAIADAMLAERAKGGGK